MYAKKQKQVDRGFLCSRVRSSGKRRDIRLVSWVVTEMLSAAKYKMIPKTYRKACAQLPEVLVEVLAKIIDAESSKNRSGAARLAEITRLSLVY